MSRAKHERIEYLETSLEITNERLKEVETALEERQDLLNRGDQLRIEDDAFACYKAHLDVKRKDIIRELDDLENGLYDDCYTDPYEEESS